MKHIFLIMNVLLIPIQGCDSPESWIPLDPSESVSFRGLFATSAYAGEVYLQINNGHFECLTYGVNGKSAGRLIADRTTVTFTDTLVFAVRPVYGPTFALLGKYVYLFDGKILQLQKVVNGGRIRYKLIAEE